MQKLLPEGMKSASFEEVKATIIAGHVKSVAGRTEIRHLYNKELKWQRSF